MWNVPKKLREFAERIEILKKKSNVLKKRIRQMEQKSEKRLNQIFITEVRKERRSYQWKINMSAPVKERIIKQADILRPYLKDENCLSDNIQGYVLPTKILQIKHAASKYSFLTVEQANQSVLLLHKNFVMKPGVYLKMHSYGYYGVISLNAKKLLFDFMEKNHMKPANHFLVFPLNQYWMNTKRRWIVTVMIRIEK